MYREYQQQRYGEEQKKSVWCFADRHAKKQTLPSIEQFSNRCLFTSSQWFGLVRFIRIFALQESRRTGMKSNRQHERVHSMHSMKSEPFYNKCTFIDPHIKLTLICGSGVRVQMDIHWRFPYWETKAAATNSKELLRRMNSSRVQELERESLWNAEICAAKQRLMFRIRSLFWYSPFCFLMGANNMINLDMKS